MFVGTQYYRQPNLPLQDWERSRTPIGVLNLAGYHRALTSVGHQVNILHAADVVDRGIPAHVRWLSLMKC